MATPQPQEGTWILTAPDGTIFESSSPMLCCREEQKTRVPERVAMARLLHSLSTCSLCGTGEPEFTLAKGTPAEISDICLTCKNNLISL